MSEKTKIIIDFVEKHKKDKEYINMEELFWYITFDKDGLPQANLMTQEKDKDKTIKVDFLTGEEPKDFCPFTCFPFASIELMTSFCEPDKQLNIYKYNFYPLNIIYKEHDFYLLPKGFYNLSKTNFPTLIPDAIKCINNKNLDFKYLNVRNGIGLHLCEGICITTNSIKPKFAMRKDFVKKVLDNMNEDIQQKLKIKTNIPKNHHTL